MSLAEKKQVFESYGATVQGDRVVLYRGGDVPSEVLRQLRYGDYLSAAQTGPDATGNEGAAAYGRTVERFDLHLSEVEVTGAGEFRFVGASPSLEGGVRYPEAIYRAYNDYHAANFTAAEIDLERDVRECASQALSGGRDEFDALLAAHEGRQTPAAEQSAPEFEYTVSLTAEEERQLQALSKQCGYALALQQNLHPCEERVAEDVKREFGTDKEGMSAIWRAVRAEPMGLLPGAPASLAKTLRRLFDDADLKNSFDVSVASETWSHEAYEAGETDEREMVVEREPWDEDDMATSRRKFNLDSVNGDLVGDVRGVYFFSAMPDETREYYERGEDKFFRLHVHAVNGREPTAHDYQYIADVLGVKIKQRPAVLARPEEKADKRSEPSPAP